MSRRKVNLLLFLIFAGAATLNWTLHPDPARPNVEFLPDMVRSARYNAFEPNPVFADGKTLQQPVPGTIPRGLLPLPYQATPEDAVRAGEELQNPFDGGDGPDLQRGANLFSTFCRPCHGPAGLGDGPVARRGFPPPPPLAAEHAAQMKDGQIFHVITYGQGNMPAYRAQISREDRWKIVLHIRRLQAQAPSPQKKTDTP